MKWHDHPCVWKSLANYHHLTGSPAACIQGIMDILSGCRVGDVVYQNTNAQFHAELRWTQDKRPFYDVYPSVTEAFINIDLSKIEPSQVVLPIKDLMVRFQVGHEFQASPRMKVRSVLASDTVARNGCRGMLLSINGGEEIHHGPTVVPIHTVRGIVMDDNCTVEELLGRGRDNPGSEEVDEEAVSNIMRLVVALCLLKGNPDLIEPEPLEADRAKWEATHDPKLLEKAARRGNRRWSVGKHIEVAPGFRRPHFAIRWCGKGGTDPQLRPIKGCLVRRQKIEDVPTGYLDELDTH